MDHTTRSFLLATAAAEIAKRYESFADLDVEKTKGRVFMETVAESLGLSALDGREKYDEGFEKLKRDLRTTFEHKAMDELNAADSEALSEQRAHADRLAELRKLHQEAMQMLADHHEKSVSQVADDDFVRFINSSHEEIVQTTERFHREFMDIIQMRHRLNLKHCFVGHLIGEETSRKLVDLYEVK